VNNQPNQMPNPMLTIRIIWGALLFSTVIYLIVVNTIVRPEEGLMENDMYKIIFPMMGLMCAGLAVGIPEILGKGLRAKIQNPSDVREVLKFYFTLFILRMALFEAVVIYGFVWAFLTRNTVYYYPMWLVGAGGMIWSFPTEAKILKWANPGSSRGAGKDPGAHVKKL
jgi:F0F1-type ATP synthase membrane subunit c/vacuolar-type H+-ATPase subunit K